MKTCKFKTGDIVSDATRAILAPLTVVGTEWLEKPEWKLLGIQPFWRVKAVAENGAFIDGQERDFEIRF